MEKELERLFRKAHPETIGEKDKAFDTSNYITWLELEFLKIRQDRSNIICDKNEEIVSLMNELQFLEKTSEAHKECFDLFIPDNKKDEATEFLSTYGSGLAKDLLKRQKK